MVLNDKWSACVGSHESGFPGLPSHRPEQVIAANFDIGWRCRAGCAAKQDALARGFEKIINYLIGTARGVPSASIDGLRVRAGTLHCYAMEVAEVRVNDSDVSSAGKMNAALSFILRGAVQPEAVEHEMIGRAVRFVGLDQVPHVEFRLGARHFQANEAIVVRSGQKKDRSRISVGIEYDSRHHILHCAAMKFRPARQRCHPRITGQSARTFLWQGLVRCAASNNDPVGVVAWLIGKPKQSAEGCSSLQC